MVTVLLIGVLIASLPAEAAQNGQSGGPSSPAGHGGGAVVGSGSYADSDSGDTSGIVETPGAEAETSWGSPGESRDNYPGAPDTAQGAGSDSSSAGHPVQAGMEKTGPDQSQSGTAMEAPGSGSGNSDVGSGRGLPRGRDPGTTTGNPYSGGQAGGKGAFAGMVISPGAVGIPRSIPANNGGYTPVPGAGGGPGPQRRQQGSPSQSGSIPCGPAQTSTLPSAASHDGNAQKDDPASRKRSRKTGLSTDTSGPDFSVPAASAPELPTLFPFSLLFFGGYRRISKKNVLEHNARNVIYEAVAEQPGIETKALAEMTGINENTLRYHLARLVATGKVTCFIRPGVVRYFRNQGAFSRFEQVVFHYLWTDTPRGILWLLSRHPGLTRQQIADALAIAGPSVTRQMEHLIEDRVVENQLSGRSNHYYLTKDATLAINQLRVRPPTLALAEVSERPRPIPAG